MKTVLKVIAGLLLMINGIGALYGGWSLITDPTGDNLQLSLSYLNDTPFSDYFIPGLILFSANGVLSFVALFALLINYNYSALFVIAQGCILSGWILIQIMMIQLVYWLHWFMGGIGLALILVGLWLYRRTCKAIKDEP